MAKPTDKKKDDKTVTENSVQELQKEESAAGMEAEKPVSESGKKMEPAGNDSETDGTKQPETEEEAGGGEAGIPVLLAKAYILYNARQYKPGEILPANNPDMAAAWVAAGTAVWSRVQAGPAKAFPVSAVPGLAGRVPGDIGRNGGITGTP